MPRVIFIYSYTKKKNVVHETNYSIEQPRPKVVKSNLWKKNQPPEYYFQSKSLSNPINET